MAIRQKSIAFIFKFLRFPYSTFGHSLAFICLLRLELQFFTHDLALYSFKTFTRAEVLECKKLLDTHKLVQIPKVHHIHLVVEQKE